VVGSAAALDVEKLVLPSRGPLRAESYADRTRLSTASGSFVANLSLPLFDDNGASDRESANTEQGRLLEVSPMPYGRRVGMRMLSVAERATTLARQVGEGDMPMRAFGFFEPGAPNATELAALAALGGPELLRYKIRLR